MRFAIILFVLASVLGGCHFVNNKLGLQDDNVAEELAEELIESKTGVDIDLTPASPE